MPRVENSTLQSQGYKSVGLLGSETIAVLSLYLFVPCQECYAAFRPVYHDNFFLQHDLTPQLSRPPVGALYTALIQIRL